MKASDFVALTLELLNSIASGDYETYQRLCATDLTCFEPECEGYLVQGLSFHKFFFELPSSPDKGKAPRDRCDEWCSCTTARRNCGHCQLRPHQSADGSMIDGPQITKSSETRVLENMGGAWKNVHMHRS